MSHVVLHRFRLKSGQEDDFVSAWERLTDVLREECGALGSRMHKADDGTYVAYARWPSRAVWQNSQDNPPKSAARSLMAATIEERFPEQHFEIVSDRLAE